MVGNPKPVSFITSFIVSLTGAIYNWVMHKFLALLLVFVFLGVLFMLPLSVNAVFPTISVPTRFTTNLISPGVATGAGFTSTAGTIGGGIPYICADPTSCAIIIGIQVFLTLFGGKLKCLFGSEKDLFAAGLSSQTVVQDSAYDNLLGIKSLTDTKGPFGGQILSVQKCKCGGKLGVKEVIMVGPPRRTMVAVTSTTKVYDYRAVRGGNWVLGRSTSEVVCRIPKALAVEMIGTSR